MAIEIVDFPIKNGDFKPQTDRFFGAQEALSGFDAMSAAASNYVKKAPKQAIAWCIYMGMGQNLVPLVNPKIAGKWMFIPLKMYL